MTIFSFFFLCACCPSSLFPLPLQLQSLSTLAQPTFLFYSSPSSLIIYAIKRPIADGNSYINFDMVPWLKMDNCSVIITKCSIIHKHVLPLLWTNVHQNPHQSAWRHWLLEVHQQLKEVPLQRLELHLENYKVISVWFSSIKLIYRTVFTLSVHIWKVAQV